MAHDRFAGEHPAISWSRRRDAKTPSQGYAPAKYLTKQWPTEAQVEDWYSFKEVLRRFAFAVPLCCWFPVTERAPLWLEKSDTRSRLPRTPAAENTNKLPDVAEIVGQMERYALDVAFRRRHR